MDVNAVLEVGTGLVIMYLLLALLCTIFVEMISTMAGWRAKNLREGIEKLLEDPNFKALKAGVFGSPLIGKAYEMGGKHGPSYLASTQFASGMIDFIGSGAWPVGKTTITPADITTAITALPASDTQRRLSQFAAEAGGEIEGFRLRIAKWYDDSMERWGGNFKRQTQLYSLIIAALIVVISNADTIGVGQKLWSDPTARAAVVAMTPSLDINNPKYENLRDKLRPFPLGWDRPNRPSEPGEWGIKLLGLAFSAFAVSLGAPFWFQILNKLNAIRGAGRKPEPAVKEG